MTKRNEAASLGQTGAKASNLLLRSLSTGDYTELHKHLQPVRYPAGHVLYQPEGKVHHVYFPEEGLVSLISIMRSGHEVESAVVGREGAVGFIEAVGAEVMFSRAVVQIDLKALRVPARTYAAAFNASAAFRRAIASHLELTMAESRQTIACISHHRVSERLAWWILECQDRTGLDHLALTQEFLSAMLGVQRTSITSAALGLKKRGFIEYHRGVIVIKDRDGLERASCECYETNAHYRRVIKTMLSPSG